MLPASLLLNAKIVKSSLEGFNIENLENLSNVFNQPNETLSIKSLDGPELLLCFEFEEPVKISQCSVKCATPGIGPISLSLFANSPNLDLQIVEDGDIKPTQTLVGSPSI